MSQPGAFEENVQKALHTRPVIEQAKGMLVALRGQTASEAFETLRDVSQRHNVRLQTLAVALVELGSGGQVDDAFVQAAVSDCLEPSDSSTSDSATVDS
ncbi:MAG TPA: ANTAR domain-containing protein [Marmoricola sp.]|nr:ANTAR domain-containing protein [Marmoricola sp.]